MDTVPPHHGEALVPQETIFPLSPEFVAEGLQNLQHSSTNMLRLITEARSRYGSADQLYTNLPFDQLVDWHVESRDFEPKGALLYKAGLLYGMELLQQVFRLADVAPKLTLTDPDAFSSALEYVRNSYRGLDDTVEGWRRQKQREQLYTGSDILSFANAALADTVLMRLDQLGLQPETNALAQHVGVVDGVIMLKAYRAYVRGREPRRFEQPLQEFAPNYDPAKHERVSLSDLHAVYEFESLDELLMAADDVQKIQYETFTGKSLAKATFSGVRRLVQIGPNQFATAFELQRIEAPRYSSKRVGQFVLAGASMDGIYLAVSSNQILRYLPVATILNGGIGAYFEVVGRRYLKRMAQERGAEFSIVQTGKHAQRV